MAYQFRGRLTILNIYTEAVMNLAFRINRKDTAKEVYTQSKREGGSHYMERLKNDREIASRFIIIV